jgi:hypothetical protein
VGDALTAAFDADVFHAWCSTRRPMARCTTIRRARACPPAALVIAASDLLALTLLVPPG